VGLDICYHPDFQSRQAISLHTFAITNDPGSQEIATTIVSGKACRMNDSSPEFLQPLKFKLTLVSMNEEVCFGAKMKKCSGSGILLLNEMSVFQTLLIVLHKSQGGGRDRS
jgi:hypothetical protein